MVGLECSHDITPAKQFNCIVNKTAGFPPRGITSHLPPSFGGLVEWLVVPSMTHFLLMDYP
jgi:hypothetical protein